MDRIPTQCDLYGRCIDVDSFLCLVCSEDLKDVSHLFFKCSFDRDVWNWVVVWLNIGILVFSWVMALIQWIDDIMLLRWKDRSWNRFSFMTVIWMLWMYQNVMLFCHTKYRKEHIFDNIVALLLEMLRIKSIGMRACKICHN